MSAQVKLTVKIKNKFTKVDAIRMLLKGVKLKEVAKTTGIPESTIRLAKDRFIEAGEYAVSTDLRKSGKKFIPVNEVAEEIATYQKDAEANLHAHIDIVSELHAELAEKDDKIQELNDLLNVLKADRDAYKASSDIRGANLESLKAKKINLRSDSLGSIKDALKAESVTITDSQYKQETLVFDGDEIKPKVFNLRKLVINFETEEVKA